MPRSVCTAALRPGWRHLTAHLARHSSLAMLLWVLLEANVVQSQAGGTDTFPAPTPDRQADVTTGDTASGAEQVLPQNTLLLPVQAAPGMRARYVKRLQKAVSRAQERAGSEAAQSLPKKHKLAEGSTPCAGDPKCLLSTGQEMGVKRIVGTVLAPIGDDFKVTMTVVDVESARLVSHSPHEVGHNALAKAGGSILENTMKSARAPLQPAKNDEPRITDKGFSIEAVSGARALPQSTPQGQPTGARGATANAAEGSAVSTPLAGGAEQGAGEPEFVKVSAADLAARMEEAQGEEEGYEGTSDGRSSGSLEDVVAEGLDELREGVKSNSSKKKRKAKGAGGGSRQAAERSAQRVRMLLTVLAGLFSFSLAFAGSYQLFGSRKKVEVSYQAQVSVKEAAQTTAILRACARQLTPGILMSAELEKSKRFCFALLDGNEVSVDVMQVKPEDKPAFRPGMQLCGQFVHEGGTAMCMLTVKRQRKISPTRLRVLFEAPERLARVTVPKGFQIPVGKQVPLVVNVKREGPPKQTWQTRAVFASDESVRLALDSDAFDLESGNQVELTVRWDDDRADLLGEVVGVDDETVTLEIGDTHGGRAPREYKKVLQRLESQWLSQLGK